MVGIVGRHQNLKPKVEVGRIGSCVAVVEVGSGRSECQLTGMNGIDSLWLSTTLVIAVAGKLS